MCNALGGGVERGVGVGGAIWQERLGAREADTRVRPAPLNHNKAAGANASLALSLADKDDNNSGDL